MPPDDFDASEVELELAAEIVDDFVGVWERESELVAARSGMLEATDETEGVKEDGNIEELPVAVCVSVSAAIDVDDDAVVGVAAGVELVGVLALLAVFAWLAED